jgi:SAM-dependent methyltransferase
VDSSRILDVGSGSAGLASFLPFSTVSVDILFPNDAIAGQNAPRQRIKASATMLPFRDSSFDAVVSMDMIEHLRPDDRPPALYEIFRVATKLAIVGFPFGKWSADFDREAMTVEQSRGLRTGWREEHVARGVPGSAEHAAVLGALRALHPQARVEWHGHEGAWGLRLRWKLQFLIPRDSRLHGLVFYPLYWVHRKGRRRKAYRRIYIARL